MESKIKQLGGIDKFIESNREINISVTSHDELEDFLKEDKSTSSLVVRGYVAMCINDLLQAKKEEVGMTEMEENELMEEQLMQLRDGGKYSYREINNLIKKSSEETEVILAKLAQRIPEFSDLSINSTVEDGKNNFSIVDYHSKMDEGSILKQVNAGGPYSVIFKDRTDEGKSVFVSARIFSDPATKRITVLYASPGKEKMSEEFQEFLFRELGGNRGNIDVNDVSETVVEEGLVGSENNEINSGLGALALLTNEGPMFRINEEKREKALGKLKGAEKELRSSLDRSRIKSKESTRLTHQKAKPSYHRPL
jgi:hypothetical protein